PPSGPPRGTYFSRRKLQQPAPPSPPLTKMVTRSTNMASRTTTSSRRFPSAALPSYSPRLAGGNGGTPRQAGGSMTRRAPRDEDQFPSGVSRRKGLPRRSSRARRRRL